MLIPSFGSEASGLSTFPNPDSKPFDPLGLARETEKNRNQRRTGRAVMSLEECELEI